MQESNKVKPDEFQIGDVVWCLARGKGTVVEIDNYGSYPVKVQFPQHSRRDAYTVDGRLEMTSRERTLFFSEPKIEASVTRPFVPTLAGKRVVVVHTSAVRLLTIFKEDKERIYVTEEGHYWDKDKIAAIYEVSSENLLKP